MDPLSIILLTAAAVQFVDFGTRLITKTADVYQDAAQAGSKVASLEAISHDVAALAGQIKEKLAPLEACNRPLSLSETKLLKLCHRCEGISKEVQLSISDINGMDSMKPSRRRKENTTDPNAFQSFKQALNLVWNESRINDMTADLAQLRAGLMSALIVDLWAQGSVQRDQPTRAKILIEQLRQEGNTNTTAPSIFHNDPNPDRLPLLVPAADNASLGDDACTRAILESLKFVSYRAREEAIPDAYQHTFDWVFREQPAEGSGKEQMPWSSFPAWLENDSENVYWITGKPGSGKSTLMKYIGSDPRTASHLAKWSSNRPNLIAAFYSWNPGVDLQRSQEGLLRSLLHQILQQAPHIAPRLFPSRWAMMKLFGQYSNPLISVPDWTLRELFESITSIDSFTNATFNLALFIDGLDEFSGDFAGLIQLIRRFHNFSGVKVCVSSRPWNDFSETFADCPQLRMELLTRGDMVRFTRGNFQSNRAFMELRGTLRAEADELISGIVDKALGVFLWVSVVTRMILGGLTDGDSLPDLRVILDELPEDLEALYSSLWGRIAPRYRPDAARTLTIFRTYTLSPQPELAESLPDPFRASGIPCHVFWVADGGAPADKTYITHTLKRRLASRTRGLLELTSSGQIDSLHRTVHDWLDTVWPRLEGVVPQEFDPNLGIINGIRSVNMEPASAWCAAFSFNEALAILCFYFASRARPNNWQARSVLVQALDQVFSWLTGALKGPRAATATAWQGTSGHDDNDQTTANPLESYLALAAQLGITSYLETKVDFQLMPGDFLNLSVFLRHLFTSLVLGTRSGTRRMWNPHPNLETLFCFNAAGRYQLAHRLIEVAEAKCQDRNALDKFLGELHKRVTEEFQSEAPVNHFRTAINVNGTDSEIPYGIAVLETLEKYGGKWSLRVQLRKAKRRAWFK